MPSLEVLDHSIDRRFCTPARLQEIVGYGGNHDSVDEIIGPKAFAADAAAAVIAQQRAIDHAVEKIEGALDDRILYRQRYRSRQPGSDLLELELPQWPAESEALELLGVDIDGYRLNRDRYVYRDGRWSATRHASRLTQEGVAGTEIENHRIDFFAGYLMPGQIDEWTANRLYIEKSSSSVGSHPLPEFGSWTLPIDPNNKLRFECTTTGTTDSSEPDWPAARPWEAGRVYATGDWALATDRPIGLWFQATSGGTSGDDEPTWPLIADELSEQDGTVTWTARAELTFAEGPSTLVWTAHFTEELPVSLQEMCALIAIETLKKIIGQPCKDKGCVDDFKRTAQALRRAA